MSTSFVKTAPPASFTCACDKSMRTACDGLPFFGKSGGKEFCVLHLPEKEKAADFEAAIQRKLADKDFNFRGVWFPREVTFENFVFEKRANFTDAEFTSTVKFVDAVFNAEAKFIRTKFNGRVDFSQARFMQAAYYYSAVFGGEAAFASSTFADGVNFGYALFMQTAYFIRTTFGAEANFAKTVFKRDANFSYATFKAHLRFSGENYKAMPAESMTFKRARIDKPSHVTFHAFSLRPHWFISINTREFQFTNIRWRVYKTERAIEILRQSEEQEERDPIETTLETIGKGAVPLRRLLGRVYRDLAINCEDNHQYDSASKFRYLAMDLQRLEHAGRFGFWRLEWWYWLASGYGERVWRALVGLIGIWLLFSLLYTQVGFEQRPQRPPAAGDAAAQRTVAEPLRGWGRLLNYSAGVMTLQKPEPRPATDAAQAVVTLETILGPVQAALLALAIRRKFMR